MITCLEKDPSGRISTGETRLIQAMQKYRMRMSGVLIQDWLGSYLYIFEHS